MKKITCAVVFLLLAAAACFGQAPAVLLQNQDVSTFYYLVDPPELEGLTPGSPLLASKVAGFFSAAGEPPLSTIAPDDSVRLTGLSSGTHLLVGFFAATEEEEFPVRVITLQVDGSIGDRFYAIFASPAQLSVPRGVGKLAGFAREGAAAEATAAAAASAGPETPKKTASSTGTDTGAGAVYAPAVSSREPLTPIKDFTQSFDPGSFTRETAGELAVLPVTLSRAWDMTGTRIASIAGARDSRGMRLSLTVPGGFSPNVSYFLYVFTGRTLGQENALTLEIAPRARGERGACLLWRKGEPRPRILGAVTSTRTTVEVDIDAGELPDAIQADADEDVTFDLTAGWHDDNLALWEEFFYTSFALSRIAVTR